MKNKIRRRRMRKKQHKSGKNNNCFVYIGWFCMSRKMSLENLAILSSSFLSHLHHRLTIILFFLFLFLHLTYTFRSMRLFIACINRFIFKTPKQKSETTHVYTHRAQSTVCAFTLEQKHTHSIREKRTFDDDQLNVCYSTSVIDNARSRV